MVCKLVKTQLMSSAEHLQSYLLSCFSLQANHKARPGETVMTCYPQSSARQVLGAGICRLAQETDLASQLWQMQKQRVSSDAAKKGEDE